MGGHSNGFGPLYEVPNPDIYKVEDAPPLKRVQERLAEKGLKDPWLRNEVWRYTALPSTPLVRTLRGVFRGAIVGIPAFLITIAVENALGISYELEHDHDVDDHH